LLYFSFFPPQLSSSYFIIVSMGGVPVPAFRQDIIQGLTLLQAPDSLSVRDFAPLALNRAKQ
jgi:hypothetical protein